MVIDNEKLVAKDHEPEPNTIVYSAQEVIYAFEDHQATTDDNLPPQKGTTAQEYIEWIADVVAEGLPGGELLTRIKILQTLDLDTFHTIDLKVSPLIDEAIALLRAGYREEVEATVRELNTFLALHPKLFVLDNEQGPRLLELSARWNNDAAELEVIASHNGPRQRVTPLFIDITQLDPEEQLAVEKYHKED